MTKPSRQGKSATPPPRGFALVVTLSLMILLTVLAVGMLSLSAISLRSSSQSQAQMQARANARLALQIAIAELQRTAGPDTRVTASADILDDAGGSPSNLAVTGVWKSWEGSDHEASGATVARPKAPVYGDKRVSSPSGRFVSWLVSKPETVADADLISNAPGWSVRDALSGMVQNEKFTDPGAPSKVSVPLLSTGSLAAGDLRQVHVMPLEIKNSESQRGAYAWWVSGENQKARLPVPYKPVNDDVAGWSVQAKSHATADPSALDLDPVLDPDGPAKAAKALSLGTSTLLVNDPLKPNPAKQFHDMSAVSVGLLTNTATGGWRKDLSLVTENWDALPAGGLPFFRINDTTTTSVSKPTTADPKATQSVFYPWSIYYTGAYFQRVVVGSWHNLKHYATAYKRPSITFPTEVITGTGTTTTTSFPYLHEIRTPMIVARVHWLFSHGTTLVPGDPNTAADDTYTLQLLITPVITMWNPYNLPLSSPPRDIRFHLMTPMPCAFQHYDKDGIPKPYRRLTRGISTTSLPGTYAVMDPSIEGFNYQLMRATEPFTLAPGETRVFSPTARAGLSEALLSLSPGYRPNTGHTVNISSFAGPLNPTSKVKVGVVCDARFPVGDEGPPDYVGACVDMLRDNTGVNFIQVDRMIIPHAIANTYWPPIPAADLASPTAAEIGGIWTPFFSAVYGPRISGPSSTGLPGKGLLQCSPMSSYLTMQFTTIAGIHPANAASDFSFFKHTPNDSLLPNANNLNNWGFIISGFTPADGLSRTIMNEIPRRPLVSLAELQNWNMRSLNGFPPFQLNIIANSDALPMIPSYDVVNDIENAFQHDDSYCANHLLFDDWFFSSIAPKSASLAPPTASETLKKTFTDFVSGADPLPNRAYKPLREDSAAAQTTSGADNLFNNHIDKPDSWQTIASRLEVEGMFNVNSTSVKAWRALLGHARNQKIPYHTEGGTALSAATDYAHSRFSVAGDAKAGEPGMSGFPGSSEITGYRVFDDAMLDILAQRIVEQVRLRGPFLSLSEFVNRQLSYYDESTNRLPLAGAIQTALNQMSVDAGANDPYAKLKSPALSKDAGDPNDPKLAGAAYAFPDAAIGKSTYGLPGWIRQADVLRPIAPILSARDDTFTIRAYGDARDANGKVTAKAWCEATVRRTRDFVDPSDAPDVTNLPYAATNQRFGRRFQIISFRWLHANEI